jgi:hypothetical protein
MLGHPHSGIAQRLDVAREVERVAQRLAGIAAFDDRRQVENLERNHRSNIALLPGVVIAGLR